MPSKRPGYPRQAASMLRCDINPRRMRAGFALEGSDQFHMGKCLGYGNHLAAVWY